MSLRRTVSFANLNNFNNENQYQSKKNPQSFKLSLPAADWPFTLPYTISKPPAKTTPFSRQSLLTNSLLGPQNLNDINDENQHQSKKNNPQSFKLPLPAADSPFTLPYTIIKSPAPATTTPNPRQSSPIGPRQNSLARPIFPPSVQKLDLYRLVLIRSARQARQARRYIRKKEKKELRKLQRQKN